MVDAHGPPHSVLLEHTQHAREIRRIECVDKRIPAESKCSWCPLFIPRGRLCAQNSALHRSVFRGVGPLSSANHPCSFATYNTHCRGARAAAIVRAVPSDVAIRRGPYLYSDRQGVRQEGRPMTSIPTASYLCELLEARCSVASAACAHLPHAKRVREERRRCRVRVRRPEVNGGCATLLPHALLATKQSVQPRKERRRQHTVHAPHLFAGERDVFGFPRVARRRG